MYLKHKKEKQFENLQSLRRLYLDTNRITKIDPNSFDDLENLEDLDISQNKLAEISKNTYAHPIKSLPPTYM